MLEAMQSTLYLVLIWWWGANVFEVSSRLHSRRAFMFTRLILQLTGELWSMPHGQCTHPSSLPTMHSIWHPLHSLLSYWSKPLLDLQERLLFAGRSLFWLWAHLRWLPIRPFLPHLYPSILQRATGRGTNGEVLILPATVLYLSRLGK